MVCSVCNNVFTEKNTIKVKEMMLGTKEEFLYNYCDNCCSLSLRNVPKNIKKYYRDYYTEQKKFIGISEFRMKLWALRRILSTTALYTLIKFFFYNDVLNWVHYSKVNIKSMILDVGCGNGFLLNEFSKHGFKNLYGIDPFLSNGNYNHLRLYKTDLLNFNCNKKFDLIMFHHSFEHIEKQGDTLEKAKSLLNDRGVIIIRTPVINEAFRIYKENWVQIDAPRHIIIHSEKSMNLLCEKYGLEIYFSYFDSTAFQFLGSEQFKIGISSYSENSYKINSSKSIFSEEDFKAFEKLAKKYNKKRIGDQAVFFIKRKC